MSDRRQTMAVSAIIAVAVYGTGMLMPQPWRTVWTLGAWVSAFLLWCWFLAHRDEVAR